MSPALADPDAYAEVYKQHLPLIQAIVRRSGCPLRLLEDVTSEVVTAIVAADGLAKYDPAKASIRTYLATYVARAAWTILARIRSQECLILEMDWVIDQADPEPPDPARFEELLSRMLESCTDEDSKAFVLAATTCASYAKARQELVQLGWESNRIRRTVRRTRAALQPCR